mgnify:CR=1 FL=1
MLQTRLQNRTSPHFSEIFEDFFGKGVGLNEGYSNRPAVNIIESEKEFKIEIAAPGLEKKDFNVEIEERKLTISSDIETEKGGDGDVYRKKQFALTKFKRFFTLPETVDANSISAIYNSGILVLLIPKMEKVKADLKRIKIG